MGIGLVSDTWFCGDDCYQVKYVHFQAMVLSSVEIWYGVNLLISVDIFASLGIRRRL